MWAIRSWVQRLMNEMWTKIFPEIKGVALWVILYGCYPAVVHYKLFLSISSNLCLPFTWHLSKCRQYNSTKNKAVEFCFILDNKNGKSTHVPQSRSWHQSSRWSGPDENHWLHGSYSPESFLTIPHLYFQERKRVEKHISQ